MVSLLFPAMGFFNVYPFRYSFVADHFQYFAGIAPIVLAVAGFTMLFGKRGGAGARRDGTMHYRLGSALMRSGRNDEALLQFTDAVRCSPYDGQAYDALGVLLFQAGRTDEAVACFKKALAINSTDELAYCNFGNAMMKLNHPDQAAGCFRKATELNPGDEVAANGLRRALEAVAAR